MLDCRTVTLNVAVHLVGAMVQTAWEPEHR
jgi:hypothetical protein